MFCCGWFFWGEGVPIPIEGGIVGLERCVGHGELVIVRGDGREGNA